MSYWNRPFFPEWCGDAILDDYKTFDTMLRIAGSFSGIAQTIKVVANMYGWTHIVLVSDDDASSVCWYGAKPFEEVFAHEKNFTFTWLRFGSDPSDEQLDNILQQIRSHTRGLCSYVFHVIIRPIDRRSGSFSGSPRRLGLHRRTKKY